MTKAPAKPIVLIPDNGPLSALAINGPDKLDCLLQLGAPLHITDIVILEATRNTGLWWNKIIADWLEDNAAKYHKVETTTGRDYIQAIELWERAGRPPDLRPKTADRGDRSIQDAIEFFEGRMTPDETIMVIVDERRLWKRLSTAEVNVEIVSTRAFFTIMEDDLKVGVAESMWRLVKIANPTMDNIDEKLVVRNVRRSYMADTGPQVSH